MDLAGEIRDWIEWSRHNLPSEGHIPKINSGRLEPPFPAAHAVDRVFDHLTPGDSPSEREKLLAQFLDAMPTGHFDVPSRYTALAFYYALRRCSSIYDEEHVLLARERLGEDLRSLVRLLPAQDCPPDWRSIRWEILNSYAANDWERALELYDRAELLRLVTPSAVRSMRGQLRFMLALTGELEDLFPKRMKELATNLVELLSKFSDIADPGSLRSVNWKEALFPHGIGLDSLEWEPDICVCPDPQDSATEDLIKDGVKRSLLFELGLCAGKSVLPLAPSQRELLLIASHDLEKALYECSEPSPICRVMLARCRFSTGHFSDAAQQYEVILGTDIRFEGLRPLLLRSAATSYTQAGDEAKAERVLQRFLNEFPKSPEAKLLVCDNSVALVTSANFTYHGLHENIEVGVKVQSKSVARIAEFLDGLISRGDVHPIDWKG